jgi:phosphoketolase
MMRVQIYTNDRPQPIDLEIVELRTRAREITTNGTGQQRGPAAIDQTLREVIRDSAVGASANLLFTTPDGREGAIYLDTEKVAAIITSWANVPSIEDPLGRSSETTTERTGV